LAEELDLSGRQLRIEVPDSQLSFGVVSPALDDVGREHGARVRIACDDRDDVGQGRLHRIETRQSRAVAQLSERVIAPTPQRSICAHYARVILAARDDGHRCVNRNGFTGLADGVRLLSLAAAAEHQQEQENHQSQQE
jgi:hypothetical protein